MIVDAFSMDQRRPALKLQKAPELKNNIGRRSQRLDIADVLFDDVVFFSSRTSRSHRIRLRRARRSTASLKSANQYHLKTPDEAFVRDAITKHGSRETASEIFAAQGWGLMRENKRESALQHFIRAWQLNHKNYQAFWGFGAILSEQG